MKERAAIDELKAGFYDMLDDAYDPGSGYDYLILFSGGKDSSYLAHLMKQAPGGRVCLFRVHNGYFSELACEKADETARRLGCDLHVCTPPRESLDKFYNFLATEPSLLELDSNPLCFFCTRLFSSLGVEYAEEKRIPFVLHGGTPDQINENLPTSTMKELATFNQLSLFFFEKARRLVVAAERYQNDEDLRAIFDRIFYQPTGTRLVFPYQYLEYHIDKIKRELEETYGWANPEGVSNEKYVASGCSMFRALGYLQRQNSAFRVHEYDNVKAEFDAGVITREAYDEFVKYIDNMLEDEASPETRRILTRLGLNE